VRWHRAAGAEASAARRFAQLMEGSLLTVGVGLLSLVACAAGILLSQSRGALVALAVGLVIVVAMLPGRRLVRLALGACALGLIFFALVLAFGAQRTVSRFNASSDAVTSRRAGISAAFRIWERFAIAGTGAGTFERVVSMEQDEKLEVIYHHAHNDYLEIAATTGTLGFLVAVSTLLGGYVALVRMTFGDAGSELSWSRRAFQVAALASLTMAMIHALFDFNFYIPSNPATLAAIMGASVASIDHDRRTRR
jgi:O-antigen ligase